MKISSMNYAGGANQFTKIRRDTTGTFGMTELWYLKNPAQGSNTIQVIMPSASASQQLSCIAASLSGVSQSTPFDVHAGSESTQDTNIHQHGGDHDRFRRLVG